MLGLLGTGTAACAAKSITADTCDGAPIVTFAPGADAGVPTTAPVFDSVQGPSCLHSLQAGAYHIVCHDNDDRIVAFRMSGSKYPLPKTLRLDVPTAAFDDDVFVIVGDEKGDYDVQLAAIDEAGHSSAATTATVSVK